jgi:hypothetical protein
MTMIRVLAILTCAICAIPAAAQTAAPPSQPAPSAAPSWSGSASLFTYAVPEEDNFVQPTVGVDHDWLHLEARFNYEDLDTASAWVGRTFSAGEHVQLEITPMAGAVFGRTNGGALGYSGSLSWRSLDLSSEAEYVFAGGDAESFLYTWSEFGWSPVDWFRGGLVVQRTKVYQTEFDIQRGFFGGVTIRRWDLSAYVFNPDVKPTVVIGVAFNF